MGLSPSVSKRQRQDLNLDPDEISLATLYCVSPESHSTCLISSHPHKNLTMGAVSLLKMKEPKLWAVKSPA